MIPKVNMFTNLIPELRAPLFTIFALISLYKLHKYQNTATAYLSILFCKGHVTRDNSFCNLQRNDDD